MIGPPHPSWTTWHAVTSLSALPLRRLVGEGGSLNNVQTCHQNEQRTHQSYPIDSLNSSNCTSKLIVTSSLGSRDGQHADWIISLHSYDTNSTLESLECPNNKTCLNSPHPQWLTLFSALIPRKEGIERWWEDVYAGGFERVSLAALVTGENIIEMEIISI